MAKRGRKRKNKYSIVVPIRLSFPKDADLISLLPNENKSTALKKILRRVCL